VFGRLHESLVWSPWLRVVGTPVEVGRGPKILLCPRSSVHDG
jgi:hypothetical protein